VRARRGVRGGRLLLGGSVFFGIAAPALAQEPAALAHGSPARTPSTHVILVTGLGGAPEYSDLFLAQGRSLLEAARGRWGLPEANTVWLAEAPERAPELIKGRSTREALEAEVLAAAGRAGPDDGVLIVLIGHGSGSGDESKINLPGPDVSGADLAVWLNAFTTQTVAVVNTASASGGFVAALSGARRIVVTATRSTRERERTYFGSYFVDAFIAAGADTDKDERVSLLEAFQYARREVGRRYERDHQLLTEHALLDDNGDGEGTAEPGSTEGDGSLAGGFFLASAGRGVTEAAADDPELARLLVEKGRLEGRIAALRMIKDTMDPAAYDAQLETLVLELATTNRSIREKGGGS